MPAKTENCRSSSGWITPPCTGRTTGRPIFRCGRRASISLAWYQALARSECIQVLVMTDTWIHSERANAWYHASEIDALRPHLNIGLPVVRPVHGGVIQPEELRQFSVFAGMSNELLDQFIG